MADKPLTHASLAAAVAELSRADGDLQSLTTLHGLPPLWARRPGFATLIQIILGQQVSLASASAAYARLRQLVGRVTPSNLRRHSHAQLTCVGLTRQKARYCRAAADAVLEGQIDLRHLDGAGNERVRAELTRITGVGPWTADIYLLMALRRPDIWPRGDRALYVATSEVKGLALDPGGLDAAADRWRPWRAVAARLLWHHYLARRRLADRKPAPPHSA